MVCVCVCVCVCGGGGGVKVTTGNLMSNAKKRHQLKEESAISNTIPATYISKMESTIN